jgi:quercetin dioxygenase-like cupin family protein
VHTFANEGPETATFLNLHAPSCGFADHLRGRDVAFDSVDAPTAEGRDPADVVVVAPGGGERHERRELVNTILLDLPELSVFALDCAQGFAVSPHAHDDHLDAFLVLAGEAEFEVGGRQAAVGPGSWSAAPPQVVHGFGSTGAEGARLLNVHAPDAGFAAAVRRRSAGPAAQG